MMRQRASRPSVRPRTTSNLPMTALALLAAGIGALPLAGQSPATEAAPRDVASVDAIIEAVYDVISGPAGQSRDWDRFRSLFIPEARLISVGRTPGGDVRYRAMTPEEYVEAAGPGLERNGFFENEIGRVTEEFGHVVHLFSSYESRSTPDADPFARGINSFQLLDDGERFWVVTIYWNAERPDLPIPPRYIGTKG